MRYNKDIILNKSIYSIVDKFRLEAHIQYINKNTHDYKIYEYPNKIVIKVNLIEEV